MSREPRSASLPSLVWRHLRTGPGASIAVAILVLVLSALAVFSPLALTALGDQALRYRLDSLSQPARDVVTSINAAPVPGPGDAGLADLPAGTAGTWGAWDSDLEKARRGAGSPASGTLSRAQYVVRYGTIDGAVASTYVALDPRYASRIRIVAGRLPNSAVTESEWNAAAQAIEDGRRNELPATEIVLSAASARAAGWTLGETRTVGREIGWAYRLPLTLVGTFDARDPDDPYWQHATGILTPAIAYDPYGQLYLKPSGYAPPSTLPLLAAATNFTKPNMRTTAWYPFVSDAITAGDAGDVVAGLRAFTSTSQTIGGKTGFGALALSFDTAAIAALDTAIGEGRSLIAVLAILAAGPIGVAVAVLVLGCRMMQERRRAAFALLSARGATGGQLRRLLGLEGLIAGFVPAAVGATFGFAAAEALLDGVIASPIAAPAILVAPLALGLLPMVALGAATPLRDRAGRPDDSTVRGGWRVITELAVVAVAVLATAVLLVRGLGGAGAALDPLVVAAPMLLALVACVLTLRVYPVFVRALLARERRGSGFVGFLGAARALRDPATGLAPVLALIVGVSVAVSSGVLLSTVQGGAESAARATVGADLQLTSSGFPDGAATEVARLAGVEKVAAVSEISSVEVLVDSTRMLLPLYLVDRTALDAVQAGHPALVPSDVSFTAGSATVPVLLSQTADALLVPEGADLKVGGSAASVAGIVVDTAPFAATSAWLLADVADTGRVSDAGLASGAPPPVVNLLVRLAPGTDAAVVAARAQKILGAGVRWSSPGSVREAVEGGPAAAGLRIVLVGCIAIAAALSAIAVMMTLVLGTRARRRILALLQSLGAPPRAGGGLVSWELWPICAVALVAGATFGAILPLLLLRVVDLRPFTGGAGQPPYLADPVVLGLAVGGFLLVTAGSTLAAIAISRRTRAGAILRTVEES